LAGSTRNFPKIEKSKFSILPKRIQRKRIRGWHPAADGRLLRKQLTAQERVYLTLQRSNLRLLRADLVLQRSDLVLQRLVRFIFHVIRLVETGFKRHISRRGTAMFGLLVGPDHLWLCSVRRAQPFPG
jgi:hypothetical protein